MEKNNWALKIKNKNKTLKYIKKMCQVKNFVV